MRVFIAFGIVCAVAAAVYAAAQGGCGQTRNSTKGRNTVEDKVDLKLDKASVTEIAEIVLVHVYGKEVLQERPWIVTKSGDIFTVEGTSHSNVEGGEAELQINGTNGSVTAISHGK